MTDLFREVDEAMRQERVEKFWQENRPYIIAVVLGTILLTGLISGYRTWDSGVKEKQTAHMIALQEAADYPQNILASEKLDLRAGLRGIALLRAGGVFLDQDKPDEALSLFQRAADDGSIPDEFKDLAAVMSVRLRIDKEGTDAQSLLDALQPVVNNPKSPWVHHARVEAALINAEKLGNFERALTHLNAVIGTPNLPASLTDRAAALAHIYRLKQAALKAEEKQDKTG